MSAFDHWPALEDLDLAEPKRRRSVRDVWESLDLSLDGRGNPHCNADNALRVMRKHPRYAGKIWLDTFRGEVIGPDGVWTDAETAKAAIFMQAECGMARMATRDVDIALGVISSENARSSAKQWMESLAWDGRPRLNFLLYFGLGVESNEYTEAVSKGFVIGMVARVYKPGAKADTLPVFEGLQGLGKSTALRKLVGDAWFAEANTSPTDKDFFLQLKGKLLIEIAELDAFGRADITAVKRVVTATTDRYRAPYAKRAEDHPRQCVFSATTNRDDWNRDATGARRFLPIVCGATDLPWIEANREQLFAEAVHRYKQGESWWDVPSDVAKAEQAARAEGDPWDEVVDRYVRDARQVTVASVLQHGISMSSDRFTKQAEMRVASILRRFGWQRKRQRVDGERAYVWERPC